MDNLAVAGILRKISALLAIKGEDVFKVRSYEKAADSIELLAKPLSDYVARGELTTVPGIGKNLAPKIEEMVRTGRSSFFERLRGEVPETVLELLEVPGIGSKTARVLFTELGVVSLARLEEELARGSLEKLPGIGKRRAELIARGVEEVKKYAGKTLLGVALPVAEKLLSRLRDKGLRCELAGEVRRRMPVVTAVEVLACPETGSADMEPGVLLSVAEDATGMQLEWNRNEASGLVSGVSSLSGIKVCVSLCPRGEFGIRELELTGDEEYVLHVKEMLAERGYVPARGGLKRLGEGETVPVFGEDDLFAVAGVRAVPPEVRHRRELWEEAEKTGIRLISTADVRGDLHVHTTWSDGLMTVSEAAASCRSLGYRYFAVTDHATRISFIDGMDGDKLRLQGEEIAGLRLLFPDMRVIRGVEVDILKDGRLSLSQDELSGVELVVASIHHGFEPPGAYLERLKAAARNPAVHVIGHPSGRKMGRRPAALEDLEELVDVCARTGTCLEVNASPDRLDLDEEGARLAWKAGVMLVIGTDAHSLEGLGDMRWGVEACLRRAGLPPGAVLNSRPLQDWFPLKKKGV